MQTVSGNLHTSTSNKHTRRKINKLEMVGNDTIWWCHKRNFIGKAAGYELIVRTWKKSWDSASFPNACRRRPEAIPALWPTHSCKRLSLGAAAKGRPTDSLE